MIDFYSYTQKFKEYLQVVNRSERTIKQHLWRLDKFTRFLKEYPLTDIQDIQEEHIIEYQKYRHYYRNRYNQQDSVRVQNYYLATLKCFFYFLKREGFIMRDPAKEVAYAKEPKRLPKSALTDSEMKKLLRVPDVKTLTGYRDRTIFELLYSTGIRKEEVMNLELQDVDYTEGYVRVNSGKGDKDRVVPLGSVACKYVENYIKGIRPMFLNAREEKRLFLSKKGLPIAKNTLGDMILKYAKKSGIEKHITTHTFRRSCATEMIKNKANLMHVKELLGHSSMETVQTYCNLSIVDLKEAHKKCHPRERIT